MQAELQRTGLACVAGSVVKCPIARRRQRRQWRVHARGCRFHRRLGCNKPPRARQKAAIQPSRVPKMPLGRFVIASSTMTSRGLQLPGLLVDKPVNGLFSKLREHPWWREPDGFPPVEPRPTMRSWCCGHFIASRRQLQRNSREWWRRMHTILVDLQMYDGKNHGAALQRTLWNGAVVATALESGSLVEHSWHYLVTGHWDYENPWTSEQEACAKFSHSRIRGYTFAYRPQNERFCRHETCNISSTQSQVEVLSTPTSSSQVPCKTEWNSSRMKIERSRETKPNPLFDVTGIHL